MTLSAVEKWRYPVIIENREGLETNFYYRALLSAKNGFYPIGLNKLVHMGIHLDKDALNKLGIAEPIKTKVNCIADGEVIAYRVNGHYPKVDYGDKVAFFSTGFVLVRHLLEMELVPETTTEAVQNNSSTDNVNNSQQNPPPVPSININSTNPTSNSVDKKEEEKNSGHRLYFYSLYMHLADSAYYDKKSKEPTPAFWEQDIYRVINKKLEKIVGLRIREKASGTIKAVLQNGTKVNLNLNLHDKSNKWYAVTSLVTGYTSIPELTPFEYKDGDKTEKILGWIYTGKAVSESVFEIKEGTDSNFAKSKGLPVKDESGEKVISMLPIDTQIKVTGTEGKDHTIELTEIIRNGQPTLPLPEGKKIVNLQSLEKISRGKKYDEVVVLDKPFPIKAGDLVGHIGNYHEYKDAIDKQKGEGGKLQDIETLPDDTFQKSYFKALLHMECFTCETLPNYITQTRTEASKLTDRNKPFLAISKSAKLLAQPMKDDTTVGKPFQGKKIKVISKNIGIHWIQIEINSSATETKTLWIENTEEIAKTAKPDGEIDLNEKTIAWTQHPLQVSELSQSIQTTDIQLSLYLNDKIITPRNKQAEDEQGTLWWKIETLDEKNLPIVGWVSTAGEGVKKVSAWDWFDFSLLTENASLLEFYKDVVLSEKRNKDAPLLDKYKPTLTATLSILDRQYPAETKQYAYIEDKCFRGIIEKPILLAALGRLLVNYESEWHSEIDTEGNMPKWEALNSEMSDDAENVLGYLKDGDEAKRDAYLKNIGKTADSEEASGLQQMRDKINQFPADYKENPEQKLNTNQLQVYRFMQVLESKIALWKKEKEKIKQCLWWDDVVKGLTKQNQSTINSDTTNKNGENTSPATLSQDGKAWFIHPISLINYFAATAAPDIIVFYIYWNGRIEKHTPSFISKKNQNKYRYIIVDKQGQKHTICDVDIVTTEEKESDVNNGDLRREAEGYWEGEIESDNTVSEGNTTRRIIYKNKDVAEFGKHPSQGSIWRRFRAMSNEIELIKMPDSLNKKFNDLSVQYAFSDTHRRYANPGLFAAMLGSIAVYNKSVTSTGSAFKWGSCFPSILHINGMSIDFLYKSYRGKDATGNPIYHPQTSQQYKDDLAFLNAMRLFFNQIRVGENEHFSEFRKLSGVINGGTLHDNHFHSEFSIEKIEETKE